MDENDYYLMNRNHIPAFGCWDCNDDQFPIPFTQCFESVRQDGLLDRDLYVAGDLYQNDILTPAMILVPRRQRKATTGKEGRKEGWVVCNCEYDEVKEAARPVPAPPKAVDEDLYKISPQLLHSKPKRKGIRGFFSMCLLPTCAS
ncbi:hypothetical protein RND71_013040 [Anisodus tanguticus]|uniref:RIN4 pathogenic type III effector avirulence factor Avr cleavage site domain-containing protein n=1 Tax=Anisodus tanguticus TaxID=243964 RepID=A0AAE1VGM4_9SOLA|nr:hypothetical protein RND71_013040 [Anisodus tanguticus]